MRAVLLCLVVVLAAACDRGAKKDDTAGSGSGSVNEDDTAREQARFDALYLVDAQANARALVGLGIDGLDAFRKARASVRQNGSIECGGAA